MRPSIEEIRKHVSEYAQDKVQAYASRLGIGDVPDTSDIEFSDVVLKTLSLREIDKMVVNAVIQRLEFQEA